MFTYELNRTNRPEWTWEQQQWRGVPYSPKPQHYWDLTIRLFSVISGHSLGWEVLPPLQRCSQCILQPQPTGQWIFVSKFFESVFGRWCCWLCFSCCMKVKSIWSLAIVHGSKLLIVSGEILLVFWFICCITSLMQKPNGGIAKGLLLWKWLNKKLFVFWCFGLFGLDWSFNAYWSDNFSHLRVFVKRSVDRKYTGGTLRLWI